MRYTSMETQTIGGIKHWFGIHIYNYVNYNDDIKNTLVKHINDDILIINKNKMETSFDNGLELNIKMYSTKNENDTLSTFLLYVNDILSGGDLLKEVMEKIRITELKNSYDKLNQIKNNIDVLERQKYENI